MMTANCPGCGMNGLAGSGLGLLQMTPVIPGTFAGLGDATSLANSLGAAAPYAAGVIGVAQGAAGGAFIGGLSCWSGKAALTGALLGGAMAGVLGGGSALIAGMSAQQAAAAVPGATTTAGLGDAASSVTIAGGVTLAIGAGLGIWATMRILKARRRGR